jgi:hypothetical protein
MTDRCHRSRSDKRDEGSFDNVDSLGMDSNNAYIDLEANITVRANPVAEINVQNYEFDAHDRNNAILSNITTNYKICSSL